MPITFGSVGDIISVSLLVKELLIALNDSRGSSAEYQAVIRELYILDTALLQVEQQLRSHTTTPELQALYETANQTVAKCRGAVSKFTAYIRKYNGSLAAGGSGNILKDTARKIQWRASQRDADIAKFRAELTGYSNSINMLLATGMVKSLNTNSEDLRDRLAEDGRRTQTTLDTHTLALKEIHIRVEENKQLISTGNSLASQMMDRLEWIQKLGSDLRRFMSSVIAGNIAIYREVLTLHSAFLKHVDRPLGEDPFILEDAIGRVAPVHLRFINSWKAFQAVMEIRFQGKQGLKKICQKEYVLQESATGREVDLSVEFEDAILPGQKITMSLVFKRDANEKSAQTVAHCPRCNMISEQPTNTDVLCSACNMWFRRIIEIQEVDLPHSTPRDTKVHFGQPSFGHAQFGPKPAKRNLEDLDSEDGDYSRFKRIRLVSKTKRIKAPRIFTEARKSSTFIFPTEMGNNASVPKAGVFKSAVDQDFELVSNNLNFQGLVEEDSLKLARSRRCGPENGQLTSISQMFGSLYRATEAKKSSTFIFPTEKEDNASIPEAGVSKSAVDEDFELVSDNLNSQGVVEEDTLRLARSRRYEPENDQSSSMSQELGSSHDRATVLGDGKDFLSSDYDSSQSLLVSTDFLSFPYEDLPQIQIDWPGSVWMPEHGAPVGDGSEGGFTKELVENIFKQALETALPSVWRNNDSPSAWMKSDRSIPRGAV